MGYNVKEVFVDLDGVLANFSKGFKDKYGFEITDFNSRTKEEKESHEKMWPKDALFLDMPVLEGAVALLLLIEELGYVPTILSSCGKHDPRANAEDKKIWIETYFPFFEFKDFKWVAKSKHKGKYAVDKNSILIDDFHICVEVWEEAGGTAIHYTTYEETKDEIIKVLSDVSK